MWLCHALLLFGCLCSFHPTPLILATTKLHVCFLVADIKGVSGIKNKEGIMEIFAKIIATFVLIAIAFLTLIVANRMLPRPVWSGYVAFVALLAAIGLVWVTSLHWAVYGVMSVLLLGSVISLFSVGTFGDSEEEKEVQEHTARGLYHVIFGMLTLAIVLLAFTLL